MILHGDVVLVLLGTIPGLDAAETFGLGGGGGSRFVAAFIMETAATVFIIARSSSIMLLLRMRGGFASSMMGFSFGCGFPLLWPGFPFVTVRSWMTVIAIPCIPISQIAIFAVVIVVT